MNLTIDNVDLETVLLRRSSVSFFIVVNHNR